MGSCALGSERRIWGSHSCGYEMSYLLGYCTVQSIEIQLTFRRNMSPPSSIIACYLLHIVVLLDWFFDPDNGGDMFLETLVDFQRITRCSSQKKELFGSEYLGSVNGWKYLDHLSEYQLLKTDYLHGVMFAVGCQASEIFVNSKV
jgi:hypothetical protein